MSNVFITLDTTVDSAYISLSKEPIVETRALTADVNVDLDRNGVAVGIETLTVNAKLPFDRLCREFHVHSKVVELLRLIRPDVGAFVGVTSAAAGTSRLKPARETERLLTYA